MSNLSHSSAKRLTLAAVVAVLLAVLLSLSYVWGIPDFSRSLKRLAMNGTCITALICSFAVLRHRMPGGAAAESEESKSPALLIANLAVWGGVGASYAMVWLS